MPSFIFFCILCNCAYNQPSTTRNFARHIRVRILTVKLLSLFINIKMSFLNIEINKKYITQLKSRAGQSFLNIKDCFVFIKYDNCY